MMLLTLSAHAQTIKISGQLAEWKTGTEIHLTNIAQVDIPVKVTANGYFHAYFPQLKKGVYNLTGVGFIYLEPGYSLQVKPDKIEHTYKFAGRGALENNLMFNCRKQLKKYFAMNNNSFSSKTYMIGVDTFLNKLGEYKKHIYDQINKSSSMFYKHIAQKDIDFYCLQNLYNYRLYYGVDSAKQEAFYKLLSSGKTNSKDLNSAYAAIHNRTLSSKQKQIFDSLCYKSWNMNDSVLFINSEIYRESVSNKITNLMYTDFRADFAAGKDQSLIKLWVVQKDINNKFISDYYIYQFTGDMITMGKDSILKDSVYRSFLGGNYNQAYKANITQLYNNYIYMSSKNVAPDFNYVNVDGRTVSLSSLRGKYVYIDVWATWCGPCKKEIPFLSAIEDEYRTRKIQFISLSVDVNKDINKWKEYVKSNQLKGIQLIADKDFNSDFIKKFNINSIPRFILIDPEGKIVSGDAKRPSDPELKELFNKLL